MNKICNYDECSKCKACMNICSQSAIFIKKNEDGFDYPVIDMDKCINCSLCKMVCYNNNEILFNKTLKYYSSWTIDEKIRNASASGGTTTQLYINALKKGYICYGVELTKEQKAEFIEIKCEEDLKKVKNSKYIYSDVKDIYPKIKQQLKKYKVLFIGMPCQIEALKKFVGFDNVNLVTIDIVCHGMGPSEFFTQHIEYIKKKNKIDEIDDITFRTNNVFDITIYGKNGKQIILKEKTDPYLIGYHNGIIYRKSCYNCKFAARDRVGDISVCDYWNLNEYDEKNSKKGITGILVNTEKGKTFLFDNAENIFIEEKNDCGIEKIVALNRPCLRTNYREKFENELNNNVDFETAINKVLRKKIMINKILFSKYVINIKKKIKKIIKKDEEKYENY